MVCPKNKIIHSEKWMSEYSCGQTYERRNGYYEKDDIVGME